MPDRALGWTSAEIAEVLDRRRFADLATVVSAPPDAPVELGAKLLVDRDGSVAGTLGSTELDALVTDDATSAMDERRSRVVS